MNPRKLFSCIGFAFCLSPVTESKTVSAVETLSNKTVLHGQNLRPKSGLAYSYPTPILFHDQIWRYSYSKVCGQRDYFWECHPIFGFGVQHFLSYAAHFCKYETQNGTLEVVSVGSGNGTIDNDIIATYAKLFGEELRITLIDSEPAFRADFRTVDDLIAKRADTVRNCILLIIWPELEQENDGYDIQAIRKLQPRAVLTMYEITGLSGSLEFLACLHPPRFRYAQGVKCRPRLNNYVIEEIAYQQVNCNPGPKKFWNVTYNFRAGLPALKFRLVKLERTN